MPNFRYSLNASTIRTTPLFEKIRVAAAAGYSGIELWHDELEAYCQSQGKIEDVRQALDEAGLKVPMTIALRGWSLVDPADDAQVWGECERRIEQAAAIGSEFIVASPPSGLVDIGDASRRYRHLVELAQPYGVRPAMEYLGFVEHIHTLSLAVQIVRHSGASGGCVVIDPFHNFRGGESFDAIEQMTLEEIAVSHFNDSPASPPREQQHDRDRVQPGDGIQPLDRWIALLKEKGYHGWLSLELFNEDLWQRDPLEVAADGLQKMRAIAER